MVIKFSSRVDYPHEDLSEEFWDKTNNTYILKPEVEKAIWKMVYSVLNENFYNANKWLETLLLGSSITGQFYKAESDIDIKIVIDKEVFKKFNPKYEKYNDKNLKEMFVEIFDTYKEKPSFKYGNHPFDFYVEFNYELPTKQFLKRFDSLYDIKNKKWLKEPVLIDIKNYDRDEEIEEGEKLALQWATKFDLQIGEIKRKVKEAELVDNYIKSLDKSRAGKFKLKLENLLDSIKKDIEKIHSEKEHVKDMYHEAYDNYEPDLEKYYSSVNSLPEVIRMKLLNLYGYISLIKKLNKIIEKKEEIAANDIEKIDDALKS